MASIFLIPVLLAVTQAACIGECAAARDESSHDDPEVMFLHMNMTTEEQTPEMFLMAAVRSLVAKLGPAANRINLSDLEAVLSQDALSHVPATEEAVLSQDAASQVPASSDVWARLTNTSMQIVNSLLADTQADQAAIETRRSGLEQCESMPVEDTALTADVERKSNIATGIEQRKLSARRGTITYNFGTSIPNAETESTAQQDQVGRRMQQYMVILSDLSKAQGELSATQSALEEANDGLVLLKDNCRCTRKNAFDEELQEVLARVEHRKSEENVAKILRCLGERPTLAEKVACTNTTSSSSHLPTINNTQVQLPAGTLCGNAGTATSQAAPKLWEGPLNTDIPGAGFHGISVGNVDACKQSCVGDKRCQAIQFSSRDSYQGKNCFLHSSQADTGPQYLSFQIYKLSRPALDTQQEV
eukprot:TRINITY_DN1666_c0_g2_i5.p1 TRINITY_DN1666_c0_g2~~TRINITY_DN1666_c0_g2_i5.p1  ORF type:complete len:418 (-),score=75.06 TRINITY_DN1666_c0_g2_i5:68-1321(-)